MPTGASQRLDKWLWFARITKTRTLATRLVTSGKVRVDRERVVKPSRMIQPGEVVTIIGPNGGGAPVGKHQLAHFCIGLCQGDRQYRTNQDDGNAQRVFDGLMQRHQQR